jgi:anti-sigma factor RsiW
MECQKDAAVLIDYCAGRLDPQAAAALEEHFAVCAGCRLRMESQRAVWATLDEWAAPPVSAGFNRQLYAKLDRLERSAWWRLHLRPALSLAGISVLALGLLVMRPPAPVAVPQQQALADTLDADRLEQALDDAEMLRQLSIL